MDVSVVVPTRNRSALLALTLRSVLTQRDVDVEVIVVDEASTDDTAAMLDAIADERIRVIRHGTPCGVASARNRGAADARGEWLAFVDDDDLWAPDKLVQQLKTAEALGRHWVYTGCVAIGDRGQILSGSPPLAPEQTIVALLRYNAIPGGGSNVVVRRTTWQKAGPFDTRLRNTEDWEMWIRLAKLGPPACVSSPLMARRLHTTNSSLDIAEVVRGTKLIEAMHHTRADWGRLHWWMAQSSLRTGQRRAAVAEFLKAAVRGEARLVASDLGTILRRRMGSILRTEKEESSPPDPWIAMAAAWLHEFRQARPETDRCASTL
jgi:glycosyltransferase involved in cell wall biosynthesis